MLLLKGRTKEKAVEAVIGQTLLDHAKANGIDWGFSCTRGTCARCRCLVEAGWDKLGAITEAERLRLDEEELEEGYRLGCQAVVVAEGFLKAQNRTYF